MEILYICLGTQRNRDTYVKMEWPLILCTNTFDMVNKNKCGFKINMKKKIK